MDFIAAVTLLFLENIYCFSSLLDTWTFSNVES